MTVSTTTQQSFAEVDDDGGANAGTLGTTNANWTQLTDTVFRIRFLVDTTGKAETDGYYLYQNYNGTGYQRVTATTQRIGSGTFTAGEWDNNGAIGSMTIPINQETELEFCVQIVGADVDDANTILFEVRFDNGGSLDGYTNTPTVTIDKPSGTLVQANYRVRLTDGQTINAAFDGGDPAINAAGSVDAETLFRIRFEIEETASVTEATAYEIRGQKNGSGGYTLLTTENQPYSAVPGVHAINSAQYADGVATTNVISGSAKGFVAGDGNENATSASISLNNQHTEIEFCLMFHAIYDGTLQNIGTDYWEFRLYKSGGTALDTYTNTARINCNIPAGWIGGTTAERPNKVIQVDTNGNMYLYHEDTVPNQAGMMLKSSDGGDSWIKVGGTQPTTGDLEAVDCSFDATNKDINIVQHSGTGAIVFHRFNTSDHATTPDAWEIKDESITASVTSDDQTAGVATRSDGTIVGFYQETVSSFESIRYKIRSSGGTWGSVNDVDSTASTNFSFCAVMEGESDWIHIAYKDNTNGDVLWTAMDPADDTLETTQTIHNDAGVGNSDKANIPVGPVYWDDAGAEKIMVASKDESDNLGYTNLITDRGTAAGAVAATSEGIDANTGFGGLGVPACLVGDGTGDVWLIYGSAVDNDMMLAYYTGGSWTGSDATLISGVTVDVVAAWIFTHSSGNGGNTVLGYIWENDSNGNTGFAQYGEYVIATPTGAVNPLMKEDSLGFSLMKGAIL
jgi:hypothetical protein